MDENPTNKQKKKIENKRIPRWRSREHHRWSLEGQATWPEAEVKPMLVVVSVEVCIIRVFVLLLHWKLS